jgi:hypothetical protein
VILVVPATKPTTLAESKSVVITVTGAIAGLLLLHTPPPGVDDNITVEPTHTFDGPTIVLGSGFTVIIAVI